MAEKELEFELNLSQYVQILSRRRWIILIVFVPVAGIAAAYAFLTPPVYRATTVVNIEKEIGSAVQKDNIGDGQDEAYFSTQHKLIKSDSALTHVYNELNLSGKKGFPDGVKSLEGAVTVLPQSGTRLCDVSADSTDPRLAVEISKALSQYFVDQNLNNKLFMSKDVLGALQHRMKGGGAENVSESLPAVVNNPLIQGIKAQIFAAEAQLADLRMKYTDNHPAIIALKSRLASMHTEETGEIANIVQSLKTELSGQLRANNVRIIDYPRLPEYPIRPRKAVALAFGLLGGLALGIFTALLFELLDQTVKTNEDMERRLGLPFLGLIPLTRRKKGELVYSSLLSPDVSLTSESFRNLRTSVAFAATAEVGPIILMTSSVQEEGKSFVAANLAVVISQLGQKVLMVDGDLRRPRQHRLLQASNDKGLSDFLSGGLTDIKLAVQKTSVPNLDVVTSGQRPTNPAELLNTERLAQFISWARGRYARVIVDCPPVFPISDVHIWGRHVEPVIFVARFGRTRVPLIRTACARLRGKGAKILGGVINGARLGTMTYADGRYYEQYYRDYVDTETPEQTAV